MAKRYKVNVQKYLYEFHYYGITETALDCWELPGRKDLEFDKFVDAAECAYKILGEIMSLLFSRLTSVQLLPALSRLYSIVRGLVASSAITS